MLLLHFPFYHSYLLSVKNIQTYIVIISAVYLKEKFFFTYHSRTVSGKVPSLHLSSECVIVSFDCRDIGTLTFNDIASKF